MTKILVIEDERSLLEEIVDVLRFEGFDSIGAENGRIGVKLAIEHRPDLIVSDVMMPELDGYGVLDELRRNPVTANIPFIFLTAKAERGSMRHGMAMGADDYITKPFTNEELLTTIRTRLDKRQQLEAEFSGQVGKVTEVIYHVLPHEFRTPLSAVIGYSTFLVEDLKNDPELQRMADAILKNGMRLLRLVENTLLYAQLEILGSDPQKLQTVRDKSTTGAATTIEYIAKDVMQDAGRIDDLDLSLESCHIMVSEENLKKMVRELLDNAVRFSEEGTSITVTLAIQGHDALLTVHNHGRGMTNEQIAAIGAHAQFDRKIYEQQGAGLGLAVVQRLADLHGGYLSIESNAGKEIAVTVGFRLAAT